MTFLQVGTPLELASDRILQSAQMLFAQNKVTGKILFNQIWNNPDKVNCAPDKMWTSLGTSAVSLRHAFGGLAQLLNTFDPTALALVEPATWALVENQDGTITCTAVAPPA